MISIKNWDKFQHYKRRDPPWIKLHRRLLDDPEWFELSGDASKMLANCWLLASEKNGELPDLPTIAFRLRLSEKRASELISQLDHWLIKDASDLLAHCKHLAPKSLSEAEAEAESESDGFEKHFAAFWQCYPKRQGSNPRKPAHDKFRVLVKNGVSPHDIIAGAQRMAADESKKVGTEFIPQAVVFLNQERWRDYTPIPSAKEFVPPPGAPTDMEIRERIRAERDRIANASTTGADLLAQSSGIRSPEANGMDRDPPRNRRV